MNYASIHASASRPSTSLGHRDGIDRVQLVIIFLIVLFPMYGTFFATETYFAPLVFKIVKEQPQSGLPPIGKITYYFLLIYMGLIYFLNAARLSGPVARSWLMFAFAFLTLVSAAWSYEPLNSATRGFRVVITAVFALYLTECMNPIRLRRLLLLVSAVNIVCDVFAAYAVPQYGLSGMTGDYSSAWRGALLHKNFLGIQMCVCAILSFDAWMTRIVDRRLSGALLLASLFVLTMSRSATSYLCTLTAFATYFLVWMIVSARDPHDRILLMIAAIMMLCLSASATFFAEELLALVGRDSTFTGRADIWAATWSAIAVSPIWGQGHAFWGLDSVLRNYIWNLLGWATPHAHNTFLDFWLQLGIPGLVLGVALFVQGGWLTLRLLAQTRSTEPLVWICIVMSLLMRAFTESQFLNEAGGTFFWMCLALVGLQKSVVRMRSEARGALAPGTGRAASLPS